MIEFERDMGSVYAPLARIKVMGVGGAGGNIVNSMISSTQYEHIDFVVLNTDAQVLKTSKAALHVQLGAKLTKGLGTGANPDLGRRAAEEDLDKIAEHLAGIDVLFIVGGLGGGTGSGAMPVIARAAREKNILTIAVVTKPFEFEGKRRMNVANGALEQLRPQVDTLIVIPNQKLLTVADQNISLINAFGMINDLSHQFVKSIADIVTKPGQINVDFADVKAIMKDMGMAVMGMGRAAGADRARHAAEQALTSSLLENMSIQGARGVLLNITAGKDLGLHEVNEVATLIYAQADEQAAIIVGWVIDDSLNDEVSVTLIATGFNQPKVQSVRALEQEIQPSRVERVHEEQMGVSAKSEIPANDIEMPTLLRRLMSERHQNK